MRGFHYFQPVVFNPQVFNDSLDCISLERFLFILSFEKHLDKVHIYLLSYYSEVVTVELNVEFTKSVCSFKTCKKPMLLPINGS